MPTLFSPRRRRRAQGRFALWLSGSGRFPVILFVVFVLMVAGYGALFQYFMGLEGRESSWSAGIYWTFVTMSTLGYGDIVFESEAGRLFSTVVLVTGAALILVLLPFVFIRFVFTPWLDRREAARAPRRLADGVTNHIVLTALDEVTEELIFLAEHEGARYVLLVADLEEALRLHDRGYVVMLGDLDDPSTYRNARLEHASLLVTTQPDTMNTNIVFTAREIAPHVTVVATANAASSAPILQLAGCDEVIELGQLLGRALARRVVGVDTRAHVIGEIDGLSIAEANVSGTDLVGKTFAETDLKDESPVNVIGVWEKGSFTTGPPRARLTAGTIMLLAGTEEQLARYDEAFAGEPARERPVLVIGGGRVGRAAAAALDAGGLRPVIVEKRGERIRAQHTYVEGDAASLEVLEQAGLHEAAAALVTTREDDVNVFLSLYLRRLRPDLQIIARATRERNVSTLYRAGADAVLSYASLGAVTMWNTLGWRRRLVIAEGVDIFRTSVPRALRGRSLREAGLEERSGCRVVALARDGELELPDRDAPLPQDVELLVIGDWAAEQRFVDRFSSR